MSSNAETEDDAVLNKGNPDELDTSASNVLESSGYCSSSVQETSSSTSPSSSSSSSAEYSITYSDINMDGVLDLDNVPTDHESVSTTATDEESTATDGELAAKDEESAAKDEKLAAKDEESAAKDEKLAAKDEESAAKDEESAAKDEESAKDEELSATDGELTATDGESAAQDEESAPKDEESAATEQESAPTEQEYVPTEQESATKEVSTATERDFVCADNSEQESAPAEKESSATDGELAATDVESATKDEESAPKDEESAATEQESVPTEQESVPTEQELVCTHAEDSEQKSASAEQESNSTDWESAATDGESAPKYEESVPTEQESATKEEESAATERDLVCACADNSEQETSVTEQETKRCREKTVFDVVQELKTTENNYLSIFKLLKKHYKDHHVHGLLYDQPDIVHDTLMHIPDIYDVTKNILEAISNRVDNWHFCPAIADIFIEYGPYLEAYSHYMVGFKQLKKKDPKYIDWTICFESGWQEKCQNLPVEHLFSAPLQKLSLYQQFLTEYLKYLTVDCGEYQRTKGALAVLEEINKKVDQKVGEYENEVCTNETQYGIIQELKNTESNYLKIFKLLHEHFKENQVQGPAYGDQTHIINEILGHLPEIIEVTENFLTAITKRCTDWPFCPSVANIFIEYGPSLKVYSHYIAGFKQLKRDDLQSYDWNKCLEVEWQGKCHNAPIEHLFAAPVNRLPLYQISLTEYLKHLTVDSREYQRTKDALAILDDVNNQVDEAIKQYSKNATALRIIHEFKTTETCYFKILKLLNVDYRAYLAHELSDEEPTKHIVNENLKHLSDIQDVTEKIVTAINERIDLRQRCPALADIFLEYGPSLKVYSHYIAGYESRIAKFKQTRKDDPKFDELNKNFEAGWQEKSQNLPIEKLFSAPVKRLPTYKFLLTEYLKHLTVDCGEYQLTKDALAMLDQVNQMISEECTKKAAFEIIHEFKATENHYLNILKLLAQDYKEGEEQGLTYGHQSDIIHETMKNLPDIQEVTGNILTAISNRVDNWHFCPALADIFLEYGPSMKAYSHYIVGFNQLKIKFVNWNETFDAEWHERCLNLPIEQLFSAPVKRLPQYRLLLTEYLKHLTVDCGEYRRTKDALVILDEINNQVDQMEREEHSKETTFKIIQELMNTESNYLSILKLLNHEYREHQSQGVRYGLQSYLPMHIVTENLRYMPDIQDITEKILAAISNRVKNWHHNPAVADIFINWGPSLKLYITYMAGYQSKLAEFKQLRRKDRMFNNWNKFFEAEWNLKCQNLAIEEMLCAPVQRLPRYRLLLTEYLKHLPVNCEEYRQTKAAIAILHAINNQADHTVRAYASMQTLLHLHSGRITDFDAFKPGRYLIKDGKLEKLTDKKGRKSLAPRWLYWFNDALLCTTPDGDNRNINYYLSIMYLTVSIPEKETVPNEFAVSNKEQSLILSTSTREDRDDWVKKIQKTVNEFMQSPTTHCLVSSAHCFISPVCQLEESVEISDIVELMERGNWEDKLLILRRNWLYISTPHKDLGDEVRIPVQGCDVQELHEWYEDKVLQSVFTLTRGYAVWKLFKAKSPTARERWMKAFRAVTGPELE